MWYSPSLVPSRDHFSRTSVFAPELLYMVLLILHKEANGVMQVRPFSIR